LIGNISSIRDRHDDGMTIRIRYLFIIQKDGYHRGILYPAHTHDVTGGQAGTMVEQSSPRRNKNFRQVLLSFTRLAKSVDLSAIIASAGGTDEVPGASRWLLHSTLGLVESNKGIYCSHYHQ
jgi:hypothetical protein